jgi:lysophospholipase L1-like esterase
VLVHDLLALGDSFTEGMSDELRADGHHRGWADRVAERLALRAPTLRYANLAVRGKQLDEVVVEQLLPARALVEDPPATLVTFHAGPNDLLRPGADTWSVALRYQRAVRLLSDTGVRVLLFTVIPRAGGKGRTADLLAARFEAFNDCVREAARRHDAVLADQGRIAALQDRRMWDLDRLHLNPQGHARVAALVLSSLVDAGVEVPAPSSDPQPGAGVDDAEPSGRQVRGEGEAAAPQLVDWWRESLPAAPPASRRQDLAADAQWLRRHLLPWVGRRLRGTSSGAGRDPKDVALRPFPPGAAVPRSPGGRVDPRPAG